MKKIVIYGVGNNCKTLLLNDIVNNISIVAFVDKYKTGQYYRGYQVHDPYHLTNLDFDEIWITNADGLQIKVFLCAEFNISDEKIKTVNEINKLCIENCVNNNKYIMISNDKDYLNYPYECLVERKEIKIVYLLFQKEAWNTQVPISNGKQVFILRSHMLGYMIRIGMLTDLRIMYPEASYALVLSDMIYGKRGYASRDKYWKNFDVIKDSFSVITTYHKQEAEKLGISYVPQPYALKSSDIEPIIDGNYVLFVGNAKDRLNKIVSIYKKLTALGIICKFWINKVEEVDIDNSLQGITYNVELKYEDYLALVKKCGCILEVSYEGNETSMRYVEAIVLGKRIMINDEQIKESIFYSPNNVYIIDKDLSNFPEWFQNENLVDYHYDGRYDPIHWFNYIKRKFDF